MKLALHQINFSPDVIEELKHYIKDKIEYIRASNEGLREDLLPRWVRIYKGTPAEDIKSFPWEGASNIVVQLSGTYCDELLSRIMAIYMTDPLFAAKLLGDFADGEGSDEKDILEEFMGNVAMEPAELDLYRVEETWWSSAIKYGTGIIKFPYEYVSEKQVLFVPGGSSEGTQEAVKFTDVVKRDGPHPENVPLNLFGIDQKFPTLDNADFIYHILKKDYFELQKMKAHPEIYIAEAIKEIESQPDGEQPDEFEKESRGTDKGHSFDNKCTPKWHIYECWLKYHHNGEIYNLIAYYHFATKTYLGAIFNPYPDNEWAFEDAKLAYDDASYYGYGFCEMLESYQEEISTTRNWKIDNKQFATTGIGRVNKNSKLSSIVNLFPGILIPADDGEIEPLQFGAGALTMTTDDENWILQQAAFRAGVDPATGGAGGGSVNAKKGIYSSAGTAMVMQSQNNRNNLRMSDMRLAHVKMGRKILSQYATFGIGAKLKQYGDRGELLKRALEMYQGKKLGLLIKPATSSLNKELEKQNDILLASTLERLYAGDAQILQALFQPGAPDELKEYLVSTLKAKSALMKTLLRNFNHSDADRLIPTPAFLKEQRNGKITGANSGGGGPAKGGAGQSLNQGVVPISSGMPSAGVPQGSEAGVR